MDPTVPFTNNTAAQDLRVLTRRPPISGGFRTPQGAEDEALRCSIGTPVRQQGWNPRSALSRTASQYLADLHDSQQARAAPLCRGPVRRAGHASRQLAESERLESRRQLVL